MRSGAMPIPETTARSPVVRSLDRCRPSRWPKTVAVGTSKPPYHNMWPVQDWSAPSGVSLWGLVLGPPAAGSGQESAAPQQASSSRQRLVFFWLPGDYVLTAASADQSVWGTLPPCKSREFSVASPRTDITLSYDRVRLVRSRRAFGGLNPGTPLSVE